MKFRSLIFSNNSMLFTIFVLGLYFSKDFGITWDESWHRLRGLEILSFLVKKLSIINLPDIPDYSPVLNNSHYFYGAFFDLTSALIEKIFSIYDKKDIFIMRHRLNFCFYFLGFYCFYLFIREVFEQKDISLLLSMFYLLNPRLLAHGFFNGKDSIAQALVCCSVFSIYLVSKTRAIKWVFIAGFFTGIGISTRISLMFILFLFPLIIIFEDFTNSKKLVIKTKSLKIISVYVITVLISLYIFMPGIWDSPLQAIKSTFFTIIDFRNWDGYVFFNGQQIKGWHVPWYYTLTWISITTPTVFLIFLMIGIIKKIHSSLYSFRMQSVFECFMLISILIAILVPIILGSTLYDSWRHSFYVFPFLAYFMAVGFIYVLTKITGFIDNRILVLCFMIVFTFFEPIRKTILLHPHQQIYFNIFAGKDPMEKFEGDYWCGSVKQGLEWIIKNDNSDIINIVSSENCPAYKNAYMVDKADRNRLNFITRRLDEEISEHRGDYYITNFRGEIDDYIKLKKIKFYPYNNEVYSIKKNNMKVLGIYKL